MNFRESGEISQPTMDEIEDKNVNEIQIFTAHTPS